MGETFVRIRKTGPTEYAVDRRSDFKCIGTVKRQNVTSMSGKQVRKWFACPFGAGGVPDSTKYDTPTEAALAVWALVMATPTDAEARGG